MGKASSETAEATTNTGGAAPGPKSFAVSGVRRSSTLLRGHETCRLSGTNSAAIFVSNRRRCASAYS
jgi:hypothetical protein